jgi:hypothetical protein
MVHFRGEENNVLSQNVFVFTQKLKILDFGRKDVFLEGKRKKIVPFQNLWLKTRKLKNSVFVKF